MSKRTASKNLWLSIKIFWYRWRFHLSVLCIIVPIIFTPRFLRDEALFSGDLGLGLRDLGQHQVGPWQVRLVEFDTMPPHRDGTAGYIKNFSLSLCHTCRQDIRAVYMRVGKPRSLRTAGQIGFGSAYNMQVGVLVAEDTSPDALLWLTAEGWDGRYYSTSIPLAEASPATIKWLERR